MPPFYADDRATVHHGDCLDVLRTLPDSSVDAVVTDPPYELGFMGKGWDASGIAYRVDLWEECLRVLKPGGHLLAFGGTRTWHRLTCAVEDAGFEIRDTITWLYGSGFPKSLDVSKAIDRQRKDNVDWQHVGTWLRTRRTEARMGTKALCAAIGAHGAVNHGGAVANWEGGLSCPTWDQWVAMREVLGFGDDMDAEVWRLNGRKGTPGEAWQSATVLGVKERALSGWSMDGDSKLIDREIKAPNSEDAARWQGWGTALKPASEPIVVARKPLAGTVAQTVLTHGTGALNIDGCRVATDWTTDPTRRGWQGRNLGHEGGAVQFVDHDKSLSQPNAAGRWPSNIVLTHAQDCVPVGTRKVRTGTAVNRNRTGMVPHTVYGDAAVPTEDVGYAAPDGTETVEAWECVPGCPVAELDAQSGHRPPSLRTARRDYATSRGTYSDGLDMAEGHVLGYTDSGSTSRFFPTFRYQAKAPARERPKVDGVAHPTVKPLTLMAWLVRLVTPPGGVVLDPFAGSGTTVEAALTEGFRCITIEREAEYLPLILARIHRQAPTKAPRPAVEQLSLLDDPAA